MCANLEATLDEFETDWDHAHLSVSYLLKLALSVLVKRLKTVSSYRVRQRHWPEVERALWKDHFWSPSSAVVSCGGAPVERVRASIANQQTFNRKPSFQKGHRATTPA